MSLIDKYEKYKANKYIEGWTHRSYELLKMLDKIQDEKLKKELLFEFDRNDKTNSILEYIAILVMFLLGVALGYLGAIQ